MQHIIDKWTDKLEVMGYDGIEIVYSGFSSQGDGVSFTGGCDIEAWLKYFKLGNDFRSVMYWHKQLGVVVDISRTDYYYCHENTIEVIIENPFEYHQYFSEEEKFNKMQAEIDNLEKVFIEKTREVCREIYADLEANYYDDIIMMTGQIKDMANQLQIITPYGVHYGGKIVKRHENGYVAVEYNGGRFGAYLANIDLEYTGEEFEAMVENTVFADIKL